LLRAAVSSSAAAASGRCQCIVGCGGHCCGTGGSGVIASACAHLVCGSAAHDGLPNKCEGRAERRAKRES
jgi:hypothetical protein